MLYKDVVAVDAEVDGLLQTAFRHDHIIEGMAFPAILAKHPHIEQHPAVQKILSPHQSGEFFFHFIHLTGGEEAAASDVNAEDGFLILQRKICLMQDGTVAADGQDDVGARKAFFQRKVLYTFHIAGLFQVILHQDDSPLHQQELRCPAGSVGSLFLSGVWRNVNSHRAVYSSVSQQIYLSRELWLAATTCSATESSSTPGCSLFWTNIRYSMLPSGPLTGLKSSPRTTKPFAAA